MVECPPFGGLMMGAASLALLLTLSLKPSYSLKYLAAKEVMAEILAYLFASYSGCINYWIALKNATMF